MPSGVYSRRPSDVRRRFDDKWIPEPNSGCWLWTGRPANGHQEYGALYFAGKNHYAHRVGWELYRGPIGAGMVLDHICRVPACVNPDHLRVVTQRQNTLENSLSVWAKNAAKTHCKYGHPLVGENIYSPPGTTHRNCRECIRRRGESSSIARAKKGAAA